MLVVLELDVADLAAERDHEGDAAAGQAQPSCGEPAVGPVGASGAWPTAAAVAPGVAAHRERPERLSGIPQPRSCRPGARTRRRAGPGALDARRGGPGQPAPGVR